MHYTWTSEFGAFVIAQRDGRWHIWHDGDRLDGPFQSAQAAAEDLANGHSAWPACGDPSRLGIPEDISDWKLSRC